MNPNCPNCKKELNLADFRDDYREPLKFFEYFCFKCKRSGLINKIKEEKE